MFIIWGFGYKTVKSFGTVAERPCENCKNRVNDEILKVTTWFTLFFIPILPYRKEFLLVCPICRNALKISKVDFEMIVDGNPAQNFNILGESSSVSALNKDKYAGKTETQISYLKQLEEFENRRNSQPRHD